MSNQRKRTVPAEGLPKLSEVDSPPFWQPDFSPPVSEDRSPPEQLPAPQPWKSSKRFAQEVDKLEGQGPNELRSQASVIISALKKRNSGGLRKLLEIAIECVEELRHEFPRASDKRIRNDLSLFFYKIGSRNERPGTTGVSHFFEHMMFNGAKKYGPGQFDFHMEKNGGNKPTTAKELGISLKTLYNKLNRWEEEKRQAAG